MKRTIARISLLALATVALAACGAGHGSAPIPSQMHTSNDGALAQEKAAALHTEEVAHAGMWRSAKAPHALPVSAPSETWKSGIVETGQAPLPGALYDITNQYQTTLGDRHVSVFAGSMRESGTGVVIVMEKSIDGKTASAPVVYPMARTGRLRITAASGQQLTLTTERGGRVGFDASRL